MISYKPLFRTLIEKDLKRSQLMHIAGIGSTQVAKFQKNEYVSLKTIESICKALNCRVEDVIEFTFPENNKDL